MNSSTTTTPTGISLRDYLAGQALAGMLAYPHTDYSYATTAEYAYSHADAMLAARGEQQPEPQQPVELPPAPQFPCVIEFRGEVWRLGPSGISLGTSFSEDYTMLARMALALGGKVVDVGGK